MRLQVGVVQTQALSEQTSVGRFAGHQIEHAIAAVGQTQDALERATQCRVVRSARHADGSAPLRRITEECLDLAIAPLLMFAKNQAGKELPEINVVVNRRISI